MLLLLNKNIKYEMIKKKKRREKRDDDVDLKLLHV
jgi:hypothetical protein